MNTGFVKSVHIIIFKVRFIAICEVTMKLTIPIIYWSIYINCLSAQHHWVEFLRKIEEKN